MYTAAQACRFRFGSLAMPHARCVAACTTYQYHESPKAHAAPPKAHSIQPEPMHVSGAGGYGGREANSHEKLYSVKQTRSWTRRHSN